MESFFITGIGTGVGKTLISAILVNKLKADYWTPIQAGDLENTDTMKVTQYCKLAPNRVHLEKFRLSQPMSPHASASIDGVDISIQDFAFPDSKNNIIIEGAGGVFVPLNLNETILDLIVHLDIPVILVSQHYLGSINHSLLSIEALRGRKIPIAGVIFNGIENLITESTIVKMGKVKHLGKIPLLDRITPKKMIALGKLIHV